MRRSATVFAPLLASAAVVILTGCKPEMQRCVDETNHVVDPQLCKNQPNTLTAQPTNGGGGVFLYPHMYRYYYGGGGGYVPGTLVTGGSYTPLSGHSYSATKGTSRGGFGSSMSGEGGGHSGGGGE